MSEDAPAIYDERKILFLLAATQFVNIVDFMIVMPLGNDFSRELAISQSKLGYVGGSYTAAAAISGLLSAFVLDRFERKRALLFAMLGLVCGTIACAFAHNFHELLLARILAGTFGGPASALAISIVSDVIPPARRGRAMGVVMMAFSLASIAGVPLALECATRFGWRSPFVVVALLGLLVATGVAVLFPQIRTQRTSGRSPFEAVRGLFRGEVLRSLLITVFAMMSAFSIIPNITPYVLSNLHYPRKELGFLYLIGGCATFATLRAGGILVDKFGSSKVAFGASLVYTTVVFAGFVAVPPVLPVVAIFVAFMVSMSFRNVAYNTLTSKVPDPQERGAFQAVQSSVQHLASAFGAFTSSLILEENAKKELVGMHEVALASITLGLAVPFLMWILERALFARAARDAEVARGPEPLATEG